MQAVLGEEGGGRGKERIRDGGESRAVKKSVEGVPE